MCDCNCHDGYEKDTLIPMVGIITDIRQETPDVKTFRVNAPEGGKLFEHMPGQCAMVCAPGVSEAMFSITSSPTNKEFQEFSIKKLNLPKDIKSLANRHGVSYHNHKINTASFSTIIEQIDEHLFKNKEKPFDNLPQYLLSILRKYWQWTLTILALIVLLLMWVQKHSNIVPDFKSNEKVISIKNNKPLVKL